MPTCRPPSARMADLLGVEPDALGDMVIPHAEAEEAEAE